MNRLIFEDFMNYSVPSGRENFWKSMNCILFKDLGVIIKQELESTSYWTKIDNYSFKLWNEVIDEISEYEINYYDINYSLYKSFLHDNISYVKQIINFIIKEINVFKDENLNLKTNSLFNNTSVSNVGANDNVGQNSLDFGSYNTNIINTKNNDIFTFNRFINYKSKSIFEELKLELLRKYGKRVW